MEDLNLKTVGKQSQAYEDFICEKWIKTILPELRRREKWLSVSKPFEIDDIVLFVDEKAPHSCYYQKKGWVIGTNKASDGRQSIRSVTIQTIDGS